MAGRRTPLLGVLGLLVAAAPVLATAAPAAADQQCTYGTTAYVPKLSAALTSLSFPQTWRVSRGRGVTVAVVDSGVSAANAHFQGALVGGKSFTSRPATTDDQGHGTAVAGIIGARYVDGSGMVGGAFESSIMPVRVYDLEGDNAAANALPPSTDRLAEGIRWATDHGAGVINVSISTGASDGQLPTLRSAVRHAIASNVVVVASSGDAKGSPVTQDRYPAAFPGVISVAATDPDGVVDDYSVHAPSVDVAAPGQGVLTTFFGNGDCVVGQQPETSWAAPYVSALAAQLKARFPDETVEELTYRIEATAQRPVQSERDDEQGWGLIQPYDALTMTFDPNREGPPFPGSKGEDKSDPGPTSPVHALGAEADPRGPVRSAAGWWLLAGTGVVALAGVLRPLARTAAARRTSRP